MNSELIDKIAAIPAGKNFGLRGQDKFYFVRRDGAAYEVWCGWIVPESHDDDAESFMNFLGKPERPAPWVGRQYVTADAEKAAEIYLEFKAGVLAGRMPTSGKSVGSVVR